MFPDKHFADLESSRRRKKALRQISLALAFLASFLFLGQAVHELVHLLSLEAIGCTYRFDAGFNLLNGLHASVQPLCTPPAGFLALFYSTGYLSTLVTGWGLILAAKTRRTGRSVLAAAGTGMLLSILLTAGAEGDIQSFVSVTGLDSGLALPIAAALSVTVLAVSFAGVKMLLED